MATVWFLLSRNFLGIPGVISAVVGDVLHVGLTERHDAEPGAGLDGSKFIANSAGMCRLFLLR
jgi:hypothetical protein